MAVGEGDKSTTTGIVLEWAVVLGCSSIEIKDIAVGVEMLELGNTGMRQDLTLLLVKARVEAEVDA